MWRHMPKVASWYSSGPKAHAEETSLTELSDFKNQNFYFYKNLFEMHFQDLIQQCWNG